MLSTIFQRVALVTLLLYQPILGAIPAPEHNRRYVIARDDGVGAIYLGAGAGMTDDEIAEVAIIASGDARVVAHDAGKPLLVLTAVYINPNNDLIIGTSGAGTGKHAEFVIKAICAEQGLEFEGGKIASRNWETGKFQRACAKCKQLLKENGEIDDICLEMRATGRRRSTSDTAQVKRWTGRNLRHSHGAMPTTSGMTMAAYNLSSLWSITQISSY
jgi:hypothetical protein